MSGDMKQGMSGDMKQGMSGDMKLGMSGDMDWNCGSILCILLYYVHTYVCILEHTLKCKEPR